MSKKLVQLLGVKERDFQTYIARLEHITMHQGVDIRLTSEIMVAARRKAAELGIEEAEQNASELYKAVKEVAAKHDVFLLKHLKVKENTSYEVLAKKLAKTITDLSKNERVLCLTPAATKRILKASPPTKTLRLLKLRSLESVMKRFDPRVLYAVACLIEAKSWKSQVHAKMKRTSGKDIVWESVEALHVPEAWYSKLEDVFKGKGFYHVNRETGVILVMPVINARRAGSTLLALSLLLQSAHRLAMESLPYKRRSFIRGQEAVLPEIAHGMQPQLHHIHGLLPSWPVVYQLFADKRVSHEEYDAELLLGDLQWQSIETKLAKLLPELSFWQGSHILAVPSKEGVISMHVVDVASNLVTKKNVHEGSTAHFEASLWNELQMRYLQEEAMTRALMKQLMSDEELMLY